MSRVKSQIESQLASGDKALLIVHKTDPTSDKPNVGYLGDPSIWDGFGDNTWPAETYINHFTWSRSPLIATYTGTDTIKVLVTFSIAAYNQNPYHRNDYCMNFKMYLNGSPLESSLISNWNKNIEANAYSFESMSSRTFGLELSTNDTLTFLKNIPEEGMVPGEMPFIGSLVIAQI